jgi:hypothetical protein
VQGEASVPVKFLLFVYMYQLHHFRVVFTFIFVRDALKRKPSFRQFVLVDLCTCTAVHVQLEDVLQRGANSEACGLT